MKQFQTDAELWVTAHGRGQTANAFPVVINSVYSLTAKLSGDRTEISFGST